MEHFYGVSGIKEKLKKMPPPPQWPYANAGIIDGETFQGTKYEASLCYLEHVRNNNFRGLSWAVAIIGSKEDCAETLEEFVSEFGSQPIYKKEDIPPPNSNDPSETVVISFWKAEQQVN